MKVKTSELTGHALDPHPLAYRFRPLEQVGAHRIADDADGSAGFLFVGQEQAAVSDLPLLHLRIGRCGAIDGRRPVIPFVDRGAARLNAPPATTQATSNER